MISVSAESSRASPEAFTLYPSGEIYSEKAAAGPHPTCRAVLDRFDCWVPSMASAKLTWVHRVGSEQTPNLKAA